MVGFSRSADRMALFPVAPNPRWRLAAILENFKWPYLRNGTSDRLRVWSYVGFSGTTDRMDLLPVGPNPRWRLAIRSEIEANLPNQINSAGSIHLSVISECCCLLLFVDDNCLWAYNSQLFHDLFLCCCILPLVSQYITHVASLRCQTKIRQYWHLLLWGSGLVVDIGLIAKLLRIGRSSKLLQKHVSSKLLMCLGQLNLLPLADGNE